MPIPPGKRMHLEQEIRLLLFQLRIARDTRPTADVEVLEDRFNELLDEYCELLAGVG